jgi:FlaA1/EpsC-like NDP-sugar epimerase
MKESRVRMRCVASGWNMACRKDRIGLEMVLNRTAVTHFVRNKVVLLTGAGGSIGAALAKALTALEPKHLILLDHSERNLNQVVTLLRTSVHSCRTSAVLGSVGDQDLLFELFDGYRPEVVFHAAAFKYVPFMETNPLAAIQNNGLATYALARLSREKSVSKLLLVSTDKAVNPISIMGASKRVAELALAAVGDSETQMSAIRLGNVLGTEGSVVPAFLNQISRGGPVTVTHPEATRYFLSLDMAVDLILQASAATTSGIFIPAVTESVNILDMALELIKKANSENHREIKILFTGLRPGDKLSEEFLYPDETATPTDFPNLSFVSHCGRGLDEFELNMTRLEERVRARDFASTLDTLRLLVPEYRPTETVIRISQGLPA